MPCSMLLLLLLLLFPDEYYMLCHRDVSMLELMMKQHQELKAKMDNRSKTIQQCADLGKILLAAGNPAAEEVSRADSV